MTQTPTSLPPSPVGVPAWLIRIVAAIVGIAGPVAAWIDPNGDIPAGGVQAAVIVVFLAAGLIIFLVHLILAAVHEYGFTMNAAAHVESDAETEFRRIWPEVKQAFDDAKPVLDQIHGVSGVIDTLSSDVTALKAREQASGLDPAAVKAALETATGMTFPAAADPATTGQTA